MNIYNNIDYISGIGRNRAALYAKADIYTVGDLLSFYPKQYINLNARVKIADCVNDENVCIKATLIKKHAPQPIRIGLNLSKATFEDETGKITAALFNDPYTLGRCEVGKEYLIHGKIKVDNYRTQLNLNRVFPADAAGLSPVYSSVKGITPTMVYLNITTVLPLVTFEDFLTREELQKYGLIDLQSAMNCIHFPKTIEDMEAAKRRIAFDELYSYRAELAKRHAENKALESVKMKKRGQQMEAFYNALPFDMTGSQKTAVAEVMDDMCKGSPMNRMLCGDVGSGKTAVAAAACVFAYANGYQSAFMAPTEILAKQHFVTLEKLLSPLGIKIALLIGALSAKEHREIQDKIASGEINVAVGTHALIADKAEFSSLALVITDEQHRFGVRQREKLASKGDNPHRLIMSATPIPRTMAMMLYGDHDISYLTDMPKGRKSVETFAVTDKLRDRAYDFIKKQIDEGRQAYIVCPRIFESKDDYNSVINYAEKLRDGAFSGYRIGVLHGMLSSDESSQIMGDFINGNIDLLVSTTVIEVGVDVPNATIILIEDAELFGLSQLHQLRGRVGRCELQSYCILVTSNPTDEVKERLKLLSSTHDGMTVAAYDLQKRGAGDFLGTKQSGFKQFKFAECVTPELMQKAEEAVMTKFS
jgi:ATP-dependent DNA helicase RecG